jgi:hypothetical protein
MVLFGSRYAPSSAASNFSISAVTAGNALIMPGVPAIVRGVPLIVATFCQALKGEWMATYAEIITKPVRAAPVIAKEAL